MEQADEIPRRRVWLKLATFLIVLAGIGVVWFVFRDRLTLSSLAAQEERLRSFGRENPVLVYAVAFTLYVTVTGLSLPGSVPMTLMTAWYFGFVRALILVSFASTAGATLAFLLSRYLLRDSIQGRFGARLRAFNEAWRREGAFYLFTLRLLPIVPFFVINLVMGLTPIRTRTFWWVSQVGMLPGTAVYVYAGASVPSLQTLAEKGVSSILTPQLIVAFVLLGLFPLAVRQIMKRIRKKTVPSSEPIPSESPHE
jgi:uncharacterized membrane protein YdjX (TVP38/TMEM64 family)